MTQLATTSESLLRTNGVSLTYFDGERKTYAVCNATIDLPPRGFIGVMGPSGSGKSSLLYVLSGLKRASEGSVIYGDRDLSDLTNAQMTALRRESFGFVFQQPWLISWQTAAENTLMGAPTVDKPARAKACRFLNELGLADYATKHPSQLSGGEKQRVCVARAMMNDPRVIFADEPTASLDHRNGHLVIDLLARYREKGLVVVVTHDAEMLQDADQVLIMRDGKTVDWVTPEELKHGK
ncbi:MAG TPA: ABC transporter ATP-binding protein [Capsulimonadaceae bacterium]|jgi:putative ABC transport system ATP-binding protein